MSHEKIPDSFCGLHCTGCAWKTSHGCGGCIETGGHPFHGDCPIGICCQSRALPHCGLCPDFPCSTLTQYSCDPTHGDTPPGKRIETCKEWRTAAPISFCAFSGINLHTSRPAELFAFYLALGFRPTELAAPNDPYYGASFALSDSPNAPRLWIWRLAENESNSFRNHLVFDTCGQMDTVYERALSTGIECAPPFTAPWGGREWILSDPDGNELLFL